jgi:hypothetical protein
MLRASLLLLAMSAAHADTLTDADIAAATVLRDSALKGSAAYPLVESLVTQVGHRMAGSAHDAQGRAWAVAKFKELGFDRVYTQPVMYSVWVRGSARAAIDGPKPTPLTIAALGGSVGTPKGGVRGNVVAFADAAELEHAPAGSLDGKIAYVRNQMTREKDGSGYGVAVVARSQGPSFAARAGAIALLIRSIGTDAHSSTPHTGMLKYADAVARIPAAALATADADVLEAALADGKPVQISLELGSRRREGVYTSANVIGEITGSEHPEEVVVIGGHLDSWDLGDGAIDNGAGVAITMAAGALIGQLPTAPKRTIRVIAFANEEQGVFGGKEYGRTHSAGLARHIIGAESDFGEGRIWRFTSKVTPQSLPTIDQMYGVLQPLGIERGDNAASGGADFAALRDLGLPLLGLDQDGTHYFDFHHTAADTLDKVQAADLDFNVGVYASMAYLAAQAGPVFGPVAAVAPAK